MNFYAAFAAVSYHNRRVRLPHWDPDRYLTRIEDSALGAVPRVVLRLLGERGQEIMLSEVNLSATELGSWKWEFVEETHVDSPLPPPPPLPDRSPESLKLELALQGVLSALSPTQRAAVDGRVYDVAEGPFMAFPLEQASIRPAEISQAQVLCGRLRSEIDGLCYKAPELHADARKRIEQHIRELCAVLKLKCLE